LSGSREDILRQIGDRWAELEAQLAEVPANRVDESGVVGPWSVKDIVGHITTWEREAMDAISNYLPGRDIASLAWPTGDIDAFNLRHVEDTRPKTVDELMADLERTHEKLLAFLAGVPEDALAMNEVVTRIRVDTFDHYAEHTASIRQWLDAGQSS
jgi:hypothetical protein